MRSHRQRNRAFGCELDACAHKKKKNEGGSHWLPPSFLVPSLRSGVAVDAPREVRVALLAVRYGEVHVVPILAILEERAFRPDRLRRPSVLAAQATQVAEPLAAAVLPERLLAEELIHRRIEGERDRECRHRVDDQVAVLRR